MISAPKSTTPLKEIPPLSDEHYIERFTRPYGGGRYDKLPDGEPENENVKGKHEWPARDQCLANTLMEAPTADRTTILNSQALTILWEVRELLEQATLVPDAVLDGSEIIDFHIERNRDFGPAEEGLKVMYESGATPSPAGSDWHAGPCVIKEGLVPANDNNASALLENVTFLYQAGRIAFDSKGRAGWRKDGKFMPFEDEIGAPKGKRVQRERAGDPPTLSIYSGAGVPRDKFGDVAVEFLAGMSGFTFAALGANEEGLAADAAHRRPDSESDVRSHADQHDRERAEERLHQIRQMLGPKPYEALVDAASGLRMDEIGGKRGCRRSAARGKVVVQVAIENLIEFRRAPKGRPRNHVGETH